MRLEETRTWRTLSVQMVMASSKHSETIASYTCNASRKISTKVQGAQISRRGKTPMGWRRVGGWRIPKHRIWDRRSVPLLTDVASRITGNGGIQAATLDQPQGQWFSERTDELAPRKYMHSSAHRESHGARERERRQGRCLDNSCKVQLPLACLPPWGRTITARKGKDALQTPLSSTID